MMNNNVISHSKCQQILNLNLKLLRKSEIVSASRPPL